MKKFLQDTLSTILAVSLAVGVVTFGTSVFVFKPTIERTNPAGSGTVFSAKEVKKLRVETLSSGTGTRRAIIAAQEEQ
jgi:hypothetical protein